MCYNRCMSQRTVGYWPLLRRNPEFTRLWIGQLVSNLGDWFNPVAVLALSTYLVGLVLEQWQHPQAWAAVAHSTPTAEWSERAVD